MSSPWYHRQPTLLPGRPLHPERLYVLRAAYAGFCMAAAFVLYSLYVVRDVGLSPFALVVVGTALEGSTLLCEVPTGVLADALSRRLSILVGTVLFGLGPLLMGLFPTIEGIVVGQLAFGVGWTFMSGAQEAWLADELGEARAAQVYPRAAQWRQGAAVAGTLAGAALGLLGHGVPFVVGGGLYMLMAVPLACTMTERPRPHAADPATGRRWLPSLTATARSGLAAVRAPVLRVPLLVALLGGAASEAFDRLWSYHLIHEVGIPGSPVDEVVLFGAIALLGQAGAFLVLRAARSVVGGTRDAVTRLLAVLFALTAVAVAVFALTGSFWVALAAVLVTRWSRDAAPPFVTAWVNRGLDPATRATVLSAVSQGDALGQVAGGPAFGLVASLRGTAAALLASAAVVAPTIALVRTKTAHDETLETVSR